MGLEKRVWNVWASLVMLFLGEETNRNIYLEALLGSASLEREVNQLVFPRLYGDRESSGT